ncbi:MAG: TsaC protein (YrdC domain) required for threonylcarbamoyladenosine t(6)A37 modification in tRNA [uncultured Rubrobacteraceae bacterium]|uniref:L-threonylcarbamoyladenylate synthase n=1 Tax=uncultured Rubrobacteraceae bacterium TaxID=349277 RepID=A0A6J4QQ91_9ACTN|nr:MAG: TsaC protein (YrdC domain) required for threonylcarbamoyladenosine t(6)A37 modification in tRNA [uncultured Rubrobacteraceae bacterium]
MRAGSAGEAASVLRDGGVVLVPTDTVVGLVAAEARRLNEVKGSDPGKPLALLCASAGEAFSLAAEVSPFARALAEAHWPGPLTLVLDMAGGGTVGVRVPGGAVVGVLRASGGPLYATSANPSGRQAPRSLAEVDPGVVAAVDLVVEGEPGSGEASAVVDLSGGKARVLRATEGFTGETLRKLTGGSSG